MPIQIKEGQSFTDVRGIEHTSAYGLITHMNIDLQEDPCFYIRLSIYLNQTIAEIGNPDTEITVFQTTVIKGNFPTFFTETILLQSGNSPCVQAELAILAHERSPGIKLLDPLIWEII